MKMHFALASPFVRKVRIVAEELGLGDRIELLTQPVTPVSPNDAIIQDNPLGKIPTLVTDDGQALYDSRTIAEYLNDLGGGTLLPASGGGKWAAKSLEALGDGMNDAMVTTRYETFLRPQEMRWPEWIRNQLNKSTRSMDHLEESFGNWPSDWNLGSIAVACALSYADFRFSELGWRDERPKLAAWYAEAAARPSMIKTAPE